MYFPEAQEFIAAYSDKLRTRPSRKMVVLMRGLPGCGKSYFTNELVERASALGIESAVCSANRYFYDEQGRYQFNPYDLVDNHRRCFEEFEQHLNGLPQLIIVDNTNITKNEIDPYVRAVDRRSDVKLHSFRFKCRNEEEAAVQCLRGIHYVPLRTVLRRYQEYTYTMHSFEETVVNPKYEDIDAYRLEKRIPNF